MKDPEKRDQWNEWMKEFQGESDRACAILGAAMLDEQLKALLETFLVDDSQVSELFQPERPLGSFSARSRMAYAVGFIAPSEMRDLNLVRKIRNDFAHDLHGVSFATPSITSRCAELAGAKMYEGFLPELGARSRYVLTVCSLTNWLALRRLSVTNSNGQRVVHAEVDRPTRLEFDV